MTQGHSDQSSSPANAGLPNSDPAGTASAAAAQAKARENGEKRKRLFKILAAVIGAAALLVVLHWVFIGSRHVTTDNAYAAADMAQITPYTGGTVQAINVVDTQVVDKGDILVVIDDTDAKIVAASAKADLARSEAELERARLDLRRRTALADTGSVSAEEVTNAETTLKTAQAFYDASRARDEQAQIDLARTVIRAPISGIVARREVQLGQRIAAGTHLLSIVPQSEIYVNANFKEVQLRNVRVGQPATVHADLYGSGVTYRGEVVGFSGGTGSAFAVIPAQNATGNWIKVVQRLPVRIALHPEDLAAHPLQVGLSMEVEVDISGKADKDETRTAAVHK